MSIERTKNQLVEMLDSEDENVIALAGRWGTGKTHLWNEVKKTSSNGKVQKSLYVSLFGLSSIDQVKRKLIEGALPETTLKGKYLEP